MAKIFADQGYLGRAAEIYRRLVARYPHRRDLLNALAQVEGRLAEQKGPSRKEVGFLLREWRDLVLRYNRTERISQTQKGRQHRQWRGEESDEKNES
jgi:hypothetical protein